MEVDPPSIGGSEPSAAPSPIPKRPHEDGAPDHGTASKRPKPADTAPEESGKGIHVEGAGEGEAKGHGEIVEAAGEKGKGDKRGDMQKKQRGKKGKEKEYVRSRRRGTRPEGQEAPLPENGEPKAPRLPKRPCALLIGFCGDGYNGMQIQPDPKLRTIEGVLFDALIKVGAVSQDNSDNPTKVKLGRAARTDAGVHAAGNVVSMKLITTIPGVPDLVGRINEELPPEIRLWSILRVQNSFNARTTCDSRKYTYFFPSYLMIPPKPDSGLHNSLREQGAETQGHPFWEAGKSNETSAEDLRRKRAYRITPEQLVALREAAKKFEGSHNFHNFTVGRDFRDRSCQRFLKSIEILDPAVYGDTEWIAVLLHGQSFMLHQIRKMISALVLSCRTGTPPHLIEEMYGPRQVFIPKMPALGLLLEYPIFESYSKRVGGVNQKLQPSDPDYRPTIDFEVHRAQLDEFKEHHIYSKMRSIEDQFGIFDGWIRSIDAYAGNDLGYLNPKGVIPTTAVIKRGEFRANPFREKKRFDATSFPAGAGAENPASIEAEESSEEEEETQLPLGKEELADMEG
ncbi:tRNA pseudouridine synthase [Lentinus tigrinus ALCF2SS1-7]|uniref:tRNA pseudouridine synthase n=1 Tax=Lentinus tigrinus ALCF2SS1-6 TaxID=1328759 RepID=A0A5C2SKG6_9APHY|nr:tRNA pseudouridine synthase [Lentinus tigrinus ALCF2SS1-6]RPD76322.1 tRNA pseudouridine synthase [Lentinus tigrinus ALCF2SS1-7]